MQITKSDVTYRLDENWPKYPESMQFETGAGVTIDDDDNIYLFHRDIEHWAAHPLAMSARMGRSAVSKFDRAGNFLGKWGHSEEPGFAVMAHTIYFIDGAIWTVDRDGHTVKKSDKRGNLLLTLGEFGKWGSSPDLFNGPTGVAVLNDGRIVVSDGYWNSRVVWFSPEGKYIKEIGGWGVQPGQFIAPHAIAVLRDGRILVAESSRGDLHPYATQDGQIAEHRKKVFPNHKGRIQIFDSEGNYLTQWTHIKPFSLAVYGNRIYAADSHSDLVVLDGTTFEELERHKNLAPFIHQMALDSHGDVYTASVNPELRGELRGPEGPSHRHWIRVND